MKTRLSLLFVCPILVLQIGFSQKSLPKRVFLIDIDAGIFNGNILGSPVQLGGGCPGCSIIVDEQIPLRSINLGIGIEVGLGGSNFVGIGYQFNEIRFIQKMEVISFPGGSFRYKENKVSKDYKGLYLAHRLKILHGKRMVMSLRNGLKFDHLIGTTEGYIGLDFRRHNFSYFASFEIAYHIGQRNEFLFLPNFRLAIRKYNNSFSDDKYYPYGLGLSIGWRSQII